jgi:NitT/TauT family transport system substrate-binding protein
MCEKQKGCDRAMKIRIGHLSTFYHTAILLMAQGDAEARLGAEIEWKLLGTGPAIMKAFQMGELDLAYIGLPPAIIGMDQGINVTCVAGGHLEGTVMSGKAQWAVSSATGDIGPVLHQFRGRTIGVPGKGSIHDVILKDCLEQYGLSQEVGIKNYPWADLVLEAVVKDEVAAAFGTPALAVAVKTYAQGKILIPPPELWPDNPSYGIVAERGFLQREQEKVGRFLELHEEATALIRSEPLKAARLIAGFVNVVDEEFVLDTLRVSPKYCAQLTAEYIKSTMKFLPVLKNHGYISSDIPQDRIFSRDLINRIHPDRDHYNEGIREG